MHVKKIISLLISSSLLISFFILTNLIYVTYAQVFEFNEEDYYDSVKSVSNTNSDDDSSTTNSEDSDNENCINNQIESVLSSSSSSSTSSDTNSNDPYTSNFHFVKISSQYHPILFQKT